MITKFERKVIAGLTAFLMCLSMIFAVPVSVNAEAESLLIKWLFGTTTKQIIQSFQYVALIFVSLMMSWQKP